MGKQTDISAAEQIARLMAQVESLSRDNERLARDNAELAKAASEAARAPEALAEELRAELAAVKAERDRLIELVRLSNQRFFGCKSEKVVPDQLSLFNDMEAAADGSPEPAFDEAVPPKPRKRGGKGGSTTPSSSRWWCATSCPRNRGNAPSAARAWRGSTSR